VSDQPFSTEQQEYLRGFMAAVLARGGPLAAAEPGLDPSDLQRVAQERSEAAGGRLAPEEFAKRRKHPLDRLDEINALATEGKFPKGLDVFLTKFHGLFYTAPAQNAFMCRLRIPGGILTAYQLRGIAVIADDLAGGYADITTRANLQLREIPAANPPEVLFRLSEIGLTSRGAGADNVRNVTGSPTAGIDRQELIDTRPHSRALHHFILYHRELYGLPRKFNIAFDGGGRVPVLEDTNDIAFSAVQLKGDDAIYYRLGLGGITGHRDFARETGVVIPPHDATKVCNAILRVFIRHGDRTDRTKARLKYLLDAWGVERFLAAVEDELGAKLTRADARTIQPRPSQDKHGHIGVHAQKQPGLNYVGVVCPVGRLIADRMRALAAIAERYGSGTLRLTVWQNLLISDIADGDLDKALSAIRAAGLDSKASAVRGGLVACTGNAGCKFSASDTKRHAAELADWLDARITLDRPINIHLTGCHNSCAQHYIADIGLLAAKVPDGEEMIEGYDLHVGGGAGAEQKIGRLVRAGLVFDEVGPIVLILLQRWMAQRAEGETFPSFTAKIADEVLTLICSETKSVSA
jgi:ferredoxin-nitrite reductase